MARQRSDLRPVVAAGALTLLALLLRFLAARQSLGGDELFSLEVAYRPTLGDVIDGVRGPLEITPPGFFVFAWAFAKLGDPTYWLKATSVVAGTLTVPVIYALGARTVGRGAGLVAGLLFAISPYAVFYGSEARAYALTGLFVALSTLFLLIALERGRWPWWVAFGVAVAASMYAHYIAAFPLAVEVVWALWYHRHRWRPLLLACAGAAVAYIPWIPGLLDDRTSPYQHAISRVWPFTLNYVGTAIEQWVAGVPTWRAAKVPGPGALVLLIVGVVLLAGGLWVARSRLPRPSPALVLLIGLALAGPVLAALWSLFEPSVFVPRSFVASLPALTLLVGAAVLAVPRLAGVVAAACLVVGLGIGTARTFGDFMARPSGPPPTTSMTTPRPASPCSRAASSTRVPWRRTCTRPARCSAPTAATPPPVRVRS